MMLCILLSSTGNSHQKLVTDCYRVLFFKLMPLPTSTFTSALQSQKTGVIVKAFVGWRWYNVTSTNHSQIHPQKTNMPPIKGPFRKSSKHYLSASMLVFAGVHPPKPWEFQKFWVPRLHFGQLKPIVTHLAGVFGMSQPMAGKKLDQVEPQKKTGLGKLSYLKQQKFMLWHCNHFSNLSSFSSVFTPEP